MNRGDFDFERAHWTFGSALVLTVLVVLALGLVLGLGLPVWRSVVTVTVLLGIPQLWVPIGLAIALEERRSWSSTRATMPLFVPIVVPIHLTFVVDPFLGWSLVDGTTVPLETFVDRYISLLFVALLLEFVDVLLLIGLFVVVDTYTAAAVDRIGWSSVAGEADPVGARVVDRLADSRFWESQTVTADRPEVDCDRCDRTGVAGVRRTTIGGVAGQPLREEIEDVCRDCRETGDGNQHDSLPDSDR